MRPEPPGLSPRVRGNPAHHRLQLRNLGSIPASAGEPRVPLTVTDTTTVYPRECGGTLRRRVPPIKVLGLSPRVRGNPLPYEGMTIEQRSIPASAGEPIASRAENTVATVYPRECGGTHLAVEEGLNAEGLSPRVRGNHGCCARWSWSSRSIPASAGEPPPGYFLVGPVGVYPRECGGTRSKVWSTT